MTVVVFPHKNTSFIEVEVIIKYLLNIRAYLGKSTSQTGRPNVIKGQWIVPQVVLATVLVLSPGRGAGRDPPPEQFPHNHAKI